jgi:hypothetical protein
MGRPIQDGHLTYRRALLEEILIRYDRIVTDFSEIDEELDLAVAVPLDHLGDGDG